MGVVAMYLCNHDGIACYVMALLPDAGRQFRGDVLQPTVLFVSGVNHNHAFTCECSHFFHLFAAKVNIK